MECNCFDEDGDYIGQCEVHVGCDSRCGALLEPVTPDEVRAAYEHWRWHHWLGGCSHAA